MKTIQTSIYSFDELSEESKQKAIENYRYKCLSYDYIYSDAYESVKKFNEIFGTSEGRNSWLNFNTSRIDDQVLNLSGLRLRTYILNNFGDYIFTKKYLKSGKLTVEKPKYHRMKKIREINQGPNKGLFSVSYYSNIQKFCECPLTGVCYDMGLLKPILDFIEKPNNQDFEDILNSCFYNLKKLIESEENYLNSDESIIDSIQANDYQFTEDGAIY